MAKSTTKRQARFMAACAHGSSFASCPPIAVAKRFNKNDEGGATLKRGVAEINRNKTGNRFAPGLKAGAAGPKAKSGKRT